MKDDVRPNGDEEAIRRLIAKCIAPGVNSEAAELFNTKHLGVTVGLVLRPYYMQQKFPLIISKTWRIPEYCRLI